MRKLNILLFSQNKKNINQINEKKTIFIVFQNIIKNEVLIHGKNTVVIDFNKTTKIELKCNTWRKDKFC